MILVSAGHYAEKQGACHEGFCEFPEASIWAAMIISELKTMGVDCLFVPSGKLGDKVLFINDRDATLAIEVHFNADPGKKGKGCETLHYPDSKKGIEAAGMVQSAMSSVMGNDRGIKAGYYQMDPKKGVDRFLRATDCTSIIIEPEFIHNKATIQDKRRECCHEIARALADYEILN